MPRITIPPLLSPIPSSVLWRYINLNQSNIDTDSPSEEPEKPGRTDSAGHTHGALPPFLRGIPIDWSAGCITWQREGCDCTVKFCPQHCQELLGSNNDKSDACSTSAPGLRVDASDPYSHSSNDKAAIGRSGHNVDDDVHNGDDDDYDADDEAGPGDLTEGEGMVSLSDRDRLSNIMYDSNETEVANTELPRPQPQGPQSTQGVQRVQGPEHQSPPPAGLGIDSEYLEALPQELRDEVIADTPAKATRTQKSRPQPQARGRGREREQVSQKEVGARPDLADLFQEFLGALPEDLRNEILPLSPLRAPAPAPSPASTSPDLSMSTTTATNKNKPTYQTSRHLAREAGPLARPQHFQRPRSDFLARVWNVSPSPACGSAQSQAPRDGIPLGSVSSPAQAQPDRSRTVPPTGFFATSTPKPVTRKLFSRSDPSQPRPTPASANNMTLGEANGVLNKVGEVIGMVTRSQSQGRHHSRSGTVEKVGEESMVGKRSGGMVTRNQGRRRGQAWNGVGEQDSLGRNPFGRNKRGKKVKENRESAEQSAEVEGKKKKKKKTLARAKREKPQRRGSIRTYGKSGKRRRRD